MWFKNLQVFQLEADWTLPAGALEEILARSPLLPCTALSLQSQGWVAPADSPALVQGLERHLLIAHGIEQKLLPASVVKDAANVHAAKWEQQHGGVKPGRKLMRDFKERAVAELLPRAFARRRSVRAWIDPAARLILVDASSPGRAEALVEQLRDGLGTLAVVRPQPEAAPGDTLTSWLAQEQAPGRFALGEECELTGSDAAKPVVRYLRHPLQAKQLRRHLDEGFRASRLALVWNNQVSFVVNDKLELKRLSFLDIDEDKDKSSGLPPEQVFEAEFALMTSTLALVVREFLEAVGALPAPAGASKAALPDRRAA